MYGERDRFNLKSRAEAGVEASLSPLCSSALLRGEKLRNAGDQGPINVVRPLQCTSQDSRFGACFLAVGIRTYWRSNAAMQHPCHSGKDTWPL
jgi:hypothetical protein